MSATSSKRVGGDRGRIRVAMMNEGGDKQEQESQVESPALESGAKRTRRPEQPFAAFSSL